MNRLLVIALLLAATARADHHEEGFVALFNGENLEGLEGHSKIWSVHEGAITGKTTEETKLRHNTFLVWKGGTVDDFELRLSYRIVGGNSGIQYRSKVDKQGEQGPIVAGYQADFEAGKTFSGILYEERGRGILAQRGQMTRVLPAEDGKHKVEVIASLGKSDDIQAGLKPEDWNDYTIIARGNRLTHIINGRVTADVTDEDAAHAARSGVLAFQVHVGPPMTVEFKNVRIKKTGASPAAASGLSSLDGTYAAAKAILDGNEVTGADLEAIELKMEGGKYHSAWNDGSDSGKFRVNNSLKPNQMDVTSDDSGEILAIYEPIPDGFRICYGLDGAPRPKAFMSEPGSKYLLIEYRRRK